MTKRFDVMSPRKRAEKTYWHRVGTAWENDKGISITFDSLPIPDDKGEVRVLLFEPREKTETAQPVRRGSADMDDDHIPFGR